MNTHSGARRCPFTMTTQEYAGDWIIQLVVNRHTCTPSSDPSGHAVRRRNALKDPDVVRQIFHKFSVNNTAKEVYDELLSMWPDLPIILKDLQNIQQDFQAVMNAGIPAIQALIAEIGNDLISSMLWTKIINLSTHIL